MSLLYNKFKKKKMKITKIVSSIFQEFDAKNAGKVCKKKILKNFRKIQVYKSDKKISKFHVQSDF